MEEEVLEYFNTTQKGIVNNDHIFQIILYDPPKLERHPVVHVKILPLCPKRPEKHAFQR